MIIIKAHHITITAISYKKKRNSKTDRRVPARFNNDCPRATAIIQMYKLESIEVDNTTESRDAFNRNTECNTCVF